MSRTRRARLRALAKINLDLRVLGKRPDGYHELRTVFQTISLADTLEVAFTHARATRITVESSVEIEGNLVERAAELVLEAAGRGGIVEFRLQKNIPMGAGLGGGSTDAAAVLLALPVLAGARIELCRLMELAAALGSDVPFFLLGGTALGLGRGTEMYPLPALPARHGLLVAPAVHSSTAEAYRALSSRLTTEAQQNKIFSLQSQLWRGGLESPANDFESVVFERFPELRRWKRRLARAGANPALMTGSGSALFGIFAGREQAALARAKLGEERVFPITLVNRARYRSVWWRQLQAHMTNHNLWPPQSRYVR